MTHYIFILIGLGVMYFIIKGYLFKTRKNEKSHSFRRRYQARKKERKNERDQGLH